MGMLIPVSEEEQRRRSITWIGVALILGFLFPVIISGFGMSKWIFANIQMIGKGNFFTTLSALYPLIAGVLVLWVGLNLEPMTRPVTLLAVGLFPFLLSILNSSDFLTSSIREYSQTTAILFLLILTLIGVYVGSRIVSITDHPSGRLMGGISGIIFLMLVLLPVTGGTPIYFELFGLLKSGSRIGIPGSLIFLGLTLIAIFTCYIFSAVIAITNFSSRPDSHHTSANSSKLVLYPTIALPLSIILAVLFSGGGSIVFGAIFTSLIKLTLWIGGIIGTIVIGLLDLIDQYLPITVKGSDLMKESPSLP